MSLLLKNPKGRKVVRLNREWMKKMNHVKNQCGSHSLNQMQIMLGLSFKTLTDRMKRDSIVFSDKPKHECPSIGCENCYFCKMKKENQNISNSLMFPFLSYNTEKHNFGCLICGITGRARQKIFNHISSLHKEEIYSESSIGKKIEEKIDCG